ncbi:hypothetical protein [Candidatus Tisiphia endosymbiont of Sialis lutaria]|uniref:tetratricopeptide repeat protein n=1 Tax=Candidatus Tisiphia endosymbiont of Sialis lutaria TaxID=2029164 RepID=UPI00312CA5D5
MFKFKKSPEKNKAEQELLNNRLKALQGSGDISKVNEPITLNSYNTLKDEYSKLTKKLTDTQSLVELNKSLAIIAVRAGKNEDALKYLLDMRTADMLRTDKFILELEPSVAKLSAEYTKTKKNEQSDSNEQPPKYLQLYHYLQTTVRTKVAAHLKNEKYTEAYDETQYLREMGSNLKVFKLYLSCIEQNKSLKSLQDKADAYIKAFNEFKLKISSSKIPEGSETVADVYKCLQTTLQNISDQIVFNKSAKSADYALKNNCNTLAAEAGNLAEQYASKQNAQEEVQVSPTVTLTPDQQKAQQQFNTAEEQFKHAQANLIIREYQLKRLEVQREYEDKCSDAVSKFGAEKAAQLEQINNDETKQLAELHVQGSSKASAPLLSDLPPYESVVKKPVSNSNLYSDALKVAAEIAAIEAVAAKAAAEAAEVAAAKAAAEAAEVAAAKAAAEAAEVAAAKAAAEAAEVAAAKAAAEAAEVAAAKAAAEAAEVAAAKAAAEAAEVAAAKAAAEAAEVAAAKAAAEVLKTTLLENVKEFITSRKTDTMKQIIVDCDNAIKKGINVYETVNDVKTLEVLASGFLSLNNQEKAEELCGKIAAISPEAYRGIGDNKVLSLLAKKYSELELYNSCIESCKNLRATSEENYQLLKTIAEKTTDTDIQLAALTAAKSKTDNLKQQAELFLSKGKILLSLGKKDQASQEFGEAAAYNPDIYKNVAEETLKSLYESGNHEVGYWYLSKTHNFSHKDPIIANKLVEFSNYVNSVHGVQGEAACLIKAYLCAPNADVLLRVQNDLSAMRHAPYAADYYKNCCAVRDTAQIETYLQGIVQVIDEHM